MAFLTDFFSRLSRVGRGQANKGVDAIEDATFEATVKQTVADMKTELDAASLATFGRPARSFGEGGTIPFMGMLGEIFPAAQFVVTGVLGPGSNAHGPNEFLHIEYATRLTECVSMVLADHGARL